MEQQCPHLLIISISILYWFRTTADCWKFDGGGPGALGPGLDSDPQLGTTHQAILRLPRSVTRAPPPVVPGAGGSFVTLLNAQQQDMLYACPLNSMCQCAGMPNETSTLIEINCNEVALYKFPVLNTAFAIFSPGEGSTTAAFKNLKMPLSLTTTAIAIYFSCSNNIF